jgi:ribonuclease HI
MDEVITLQFDGGSRGNPGPAGVGVVLSAADGTPLVTLGRFIGRATNNVAEYKGLITALEQAKTLGARRIVVRGDSELIIKQMRGEYRVKNPDLRVLYDQAKALIAQFEQAKIEHNYRESNELADKLANLAMDRRRDVTDVMETSGRGAESAAGRVAETGPGGDAGLRPAAKRGPVSKVSVSGSAGSGDGVDGAAGAAAKGARFSCPRCGCSIVVEVASSRPPAETGPFACACGVRMKPAE